MLSRKRHIDPVITTIGILVAVVLAFFGLSIFVLFTSNSEGYGYQILSYVLGHS